MPRKADERGFGFRSEGLLRILVGADAEQVLIAVEELGFRLPDRKPLETLVEVVTVAHGEAEDIIVRHLIDLEQSIRKALTTLDFGVPPGHVEHGQAAGERALRQLLARREQFALALEQKRRNVIEAIKRVDEVFFKIGAI